MQAPLVWVTVFFLLVKSTSQSDIVYSNPASSFEYTEQICTDIPLHICCVPMDILIPDIGHGWFRAERIEFTHMPKRPMFLTAWKYRVGARQSACHGYSSGTRTEGEETWSYGYLPSEEWPGLSGGWIVERESIQNGNDKLGTAPPEVAFPDLIRYLGDDYTDGKKGDGVYRYSTGKILRAEPLWRKSDLLKGILSSNSDARCSCNSVNPDKIKPSSC